MRYMLIIPIFCIFGTISLYAEENSLGDILQRVGEQKTFVKPAPKKKILKKKSRFIFKDTYNDNGIGSKGKAREKKKSKSYDYANKSRFKFKINDGSPQSNMMGGSGGTSAGMSAGGMSGGSMGGGGKGRGGGGR
ncbi:MAG: hypothetical protein GQ531_07415 [Sulfurovum sp.]|nr:hypothetical protein [Sulfurovum sp.]